MPEDQVIRKLPLILASEPPVTPLNRFQALKDTNLSQGQISKLFTPEFYTPDPATPGALTADDLIAHLGGIDTSLEVHVDQWGPPVSTFAALRAILPADRFDRQLRFVEEVILTDRGIYAFDVELTGADDGFITLVPDDVTPPDPGRWRRTAGGGLEPPTINVVTTTDDTPTNIATIAIPDDTVVILEARILARRTDLAGRAVYIRNSAIFREAAGGATLEGAVDSPFTRESTGNAPWDATIIMSGNNAIIQVTGQAGKTVNWKSSHRTEKVI
ncbi:hypothetical protein LCGC14_2581620 [marine sediment metagenome]|uniref:Uncharacterized protein n=1 Tax=marine sediment metagenome TaxID=412755 RepID=A0A0F9CQD8_9ZZZZ